MDLARRRCKPLEGGQPLAATEAKRYLEQVPGWAVEGGTAIRKAFDFRNFHETMGFVNAVAWIANREDHHPDLTVGYKCCEVRYSTHSVGGLSENDFICAAKIDELLK